LTCQSRRLLFEGRIHHLWSALIGQAFLDGYELLADRRYLGRRGERMPHGFWGSRERTKMGTCISYMATGQYSIHNANMLGAAVLARTGRTVRKEEYLDVASEAMKYSCSRSDRTDHGGTLRNPDIGGLTTFTQDIIWTVSNAISITRVTNYREGMCKGLEFFQGVFFGTTDAHDIINRTYPIDSQCAAQRSKPYRIFRIVMKNVSRWQSKLPIGSSRHMQDKEAVLLLQEIPSHQGKNTDASLGSGHILPGARPAPLCDFRCFSQSDSEVLGTGDMGGPWFQLGQHCH